MVAVFCFCWGPYASFAMINITGHGKVGDQNSCRDLQVWPSITRTFPWYWPSCLFNFVKLSSSGTRSSLSSWTPWYNFPFFNSIESLHCIVWMIPQTCTFTSWHCRWCNFPTSQIRLQNLFMNTISSTGRWLGHSFIYGWLLVSDSVILTNVFGTESKRQLKMTNCERNL